MSGFIGRYCEVERTNGFRERGFVLSKTTTESAFWIELFVQTTCGWEAVHMWVRTVTSVENPRFILLPKFCDYRGVLDLSKKQLHIECQKIPFSKINQVNNLIKKHGAKSKPANTATGRRSGRKKT